MSSLSPLLSLLSSERIAAYRKAASDSEECLLARYRWNIALCEACYPALSLFEVALRNAIDFTMKPTYGIEWLSATSSLLKPPEIAEAQKHCQKLVNKKYGLTVSDVNRNQLIASLTLGFWTGLFRKEYAVIWHRHIKTVFPYLRAKNRTPAFVFQRLTHIRLLRNRVFHHEPLWHWPNLSQRYQEIQEALYWISPLLKESLEPLDRFASVYQHGPIISE